MSISIEISHLCPAENGMKACESIFLMFSASKRSGLYSWCEKQKRHVWGNEDKSPRKGQGVELKVQSPGPHLETRSWILDRDTNSYPIAKTQCLVLSNSSYCLWNHYLPIENGVPKRRNQRIQSVYISHHVVLPPDMWVVVHRNDVQVESGELGEQHPSHCQGSGDLSGNHRYRSV